MLKLGVGLEQKQPVDVVVLRQPEDVFEDDWDVLFADPEQAASGFVDVSLEEALGELMEQHGQHVDQNVDDAVAGAAGGIVTPGFGHVAEDWVDVRFGWQGFLWHGFRFTLKFSFERWGWQVRCPYHKGNTPTALQCKQWIPFGDDLTDYGRQLGLRKAKRWCLMFGCGRKSEHLRQNPDDRALLWPTDSVLENHAYDNLGPPPNFADVLSDAVLDLMGNDDAAG